MRTKIKPCDLWPVILTLGLSFAAFSGGSPQPRLVRSTLVENVRGKIAQNPQMRAEEITAYANALLRQKGYNYTFDICEFMTAKKLGGVRSSPEDGFYRLPFRFMGEGERPFQVSIGEGICGECFADIPVTKISSQEIQAVINGRSYRLRRPATFALDEMTLVDKTMRKVLRKWEVPSQTYPLGISSDGQTLYLPVEFSDDDLEAVRWVLWKDGNPKKQVPTSVLAISSASIRFEVAAQVLREQQAEQIKNHPSDPQNDYLAFRRFQVADKTYIIRYSTPCT